MTFKGIVALLVILALSRSAFCDPAKTEYYPRETVDSPEWCGSYLKAAHESALYPLTQSNRQVETYRLAIYPPFTDVVILDLKVRQDGLAEMTLTKLGQEPGPLKRKATFLLTSVGLRHFRDQMTRIDFWHLDTLKKSDDEINDGTVFIYEGCHAGRYQVLERIEPQKDTSFCEPAYYLLKLAQESTEGF